MRIAEKPERIACADPVIPVILGVAVACYDSVARGEGFVHFGNEILVQKVVRIKEEKSVVPREHTRGAQPFKQEIKRISLANAHGVKPLKYDCAACARDCGRAIRAVVRADVNIHKAAGVFLGMDAFDQVPDDGLLVAGAEDCRIAPGHGGRQRFWAFEKRHGEIDDLICEAGAEQRRKKVVYAR